MIDKLAENQNWAKLAPWLAIISASFLLANFKPSEAIFWALINIPLYLFHQTEEHYWPGGFKNYINQVINQLPEGEESLTDEKVFWINILLVWVSFSIFGILAFINIGFGLLIIIFSMMNCFTHIAQGIKHKGWNPGLIMASVQFMISVYGAYFITTNGLTDPWFWWTGTIVFSVIVHVLLFKFVMKNDTESK